MISRFLVTLTFVFVLSPPAMAQDWTSADGLLSVTAPDAEMFQELPSPPEPFEVLWVSNDETLKFGVIKTPMPAHILLEQSSAEEGLAEQIDGDVTRLPTKQLSGHEVWTMRGTGPTAELTQSMVRHDSVLYKVMAAVVDDGSSKDYRATVDQFIASLSIHDGTHSLASSQSQPNSQPNRQLGASTGPFDSHWFSKTVGGACGLLFVGLVIFFAMKRLSSNQSRLT